MNDAGKSSPNGKSSTHSKHSKEWQERGYNERCGRLGRAIAARSKRAAVESVGVRLCTTSMTARGSTFIETGPSRARMSAPSLARLPE